MNKYLDWPLKEVNASFWENFELFRVEEFPELGAPSRKANYYQRWSGLSGGFALSAVNSGKSKYISVELIADNGILDHVEVELRRCWTELRLKYLENLEWEESDRKKTRIFELISCDIRESSDWERQCRWLGNRLIRLREIFSPKLDRITGEKT